MDETQAHVEPRTATCAVSGERRADYFKESEACIKHKS